MFFSKSSICAINFNTGFETICGYSCSGHSLPALEIPPALFGAREAVPLSLAAAGTGSGSCRRSRGSLQRRGVARLNAWIGMMTVTIIVIMIVIMSAIVIVSNNINNSNLCLIIWLYLHVGIFRV